MKKVIIIGASSGLGADLAKEFSKNGFEIGLTARRQALLEDLQKELPNKSYIKLMDVADTELAREQLAELVEEMDGVDIIVVNAGIGGPKADWKKEHQIISINALGFAALAQWSFNYFKDKGGGILAGTSSVLAIRSTRFTTVYSATKAFISSYMQGLRHRSIHGKLNISVVDIRPGFVHTPINAGSKNVFWAVDSPTAAKAMYKAIIKKKRVVYIPTRWWFVAILIKLLPDSLAYRT